VVAADGGTAPASITGAYLAARLACKNCSTQKKSRKSVVDSVAAVSAGIRRKALPRFELRRDATRSRRNIVMTGRGVRRSAEQRRERHFPASSSRRCALSHQA